MESLQTFENTLQQLQLQLQLNDNVYVLGSV